MRVMVLALPHSIGKHSSGSAEMKFSRNKLFDAIGFDRSSLILAASTRVLQMSTSGRFHDGFL